MSTILVAGCWSGEGVAADGEGGLGGVEQGGADRELWQVACILTKYTINCEASGNCHKKSTQQMRGP